MRAIRRAARVYTVRWKSVFFRSLPVAAASVFFLQILPWSLFYMSALQGLEAKNAESILSLLTNLLLRPVSCAMMAVCMCRRWEGRSAGFRATILFVKTNLFRLVLTGCIAWGAGQCFGMLLELFPALIALMRALLGWIPGLEVVFSCLHAVVSFVVSGFRQYLIHMLAVCFMLPLISDQVWGKRQVLRGLKWMWGGRPDSFWAMGLVSVGWCLFLEMETLCLELFLLRTLWLPLSASALVCVMLTERDRQEGIKLRIYVEE